MTFTTNSWVKTKTKNPNYSGVDLKVRTQGYVKIDFFKNNVCYLKELKYELYVENSMVIF